MADQIILADTSVLIDFFRKTDKENAKLIALFDQGYDFAIAAITHYEIYSGATQVQLEFRTSFLQRTTVLPFNEKASQLAVDINADLKKKRKGIGMADLFMAATAIVNKLPPATLNRKHFDRIAQLEMVE